MIHPSATSAIPSENTLGVAQAPCLRTVGADFYSDAMDSQHRGVSQELVDAQASPGQPRSVLERVTTVLAILDVPAELSMITQVSSALEPTKLPAAQLKTLLRSEERALRRSTIGQPRVCAALDAEYLTALRQVRHALPQWPLERRLYGPLSRRVDFLTATINLAEHLAGHPNPGKRAVTLLQRYASSIPGCGNWPTFTQAADRARDELSIHADADTADRTQAADHARARLDDIQQLFGGPATTLPANPADGGMDAAFLGMKGSSPLAVDTAAAVWAGEPEIADATTGMDIH